MLPGSILIITLLIISTTAIIGISGIDDFFCDQYVNDQCSGCPSGKLVCEKGNSKNYQDLFKHISENQNDYYKYRELTIRSNELKEIPANLFSVVSSEKVEIICPNLKYVDPDAFAGSNFECPSLTIKDGNISSPESTKSLFQAVSKLENVYELHLINNNMPGIPPNAFSKQLRNLDQIEIDDISIKNLGSSAFSAIDLRMLHLTTSIDVYPPYAFTHDKEKDYFDFDLQLTHNSNTKFNNLSFLNIGWPTTISLSPKLRVIPEKVFLPFLLDNKKNIIDPDSSDFDCDNCANYWVVKNKLQDRFVRIFKLENSDPVKTYMKCSNKRSLIEPKNFAGCDSSKDWLHTLLPCTFNISTNSIYCGGHDNIDLTYIFENTSGNLHKSQKHFTRLLLNNTAIYELKNSTFSDITFDEIIIENCRNLTSIQSHAFNGTNSVTKVLVIENNNQLDSKPGNLIWDAFNSFVNLENLRLNNNNIKDIPANAFKNKQDNLKEIQLHGNSFEKLGANSFFKLKNLTRLSFYQAQLNKIPEYAFDFETSSINQFNLSLSHLSGLNSSGFQDNCFSYTKRPTYIEISPSNELEILNKIVFERFLTVSPLNKINFHKNRIDCDDTRNNWIKTESKLKDRIQNLMCSNGKSLNDPDNFKGRANSN